MAVNLSPIGNGFQFFTTTGLPLASGYIYTYVAGSTTPQSTYTDSTGATANTNPIQLGTDGRPPTEIWFTASANYKFVLADSSNVVIQTIPSGYYLCDGTNGTPDLRDRFVVGAGSSYAVGNTGGFTSSVTSNIGTNLPLYYALAFIQKS